MEENEIELKPCPFCGGEARFAGGEVFDWVSCTSCRAESRCECSKVEAAEAWNRRADVAPVVHGRWGDPGDVCTVCGCSYMDYADADSSWAMGHPVPDYCPSCGARMDGECQE